MLSVNQLVGFNVGDSGFPGGNLIAADIYSACQTMASGATVAPTAGGTLTLNGEALGSYDYTIKNGNQTISSYTNGDWFTTTEDSRSAFIIVNGNLTIDSGQTLIPTQRKLFTAIYVTGTLTVTGAISMTARGANHSAGGGNVSAAAIRIATGTFSAVTNPQVPATGANGGAQNSPSSGVQAAGNAGSNSDGAGSTGGGGTGGASNNLGTATSPAAAAGTSFSGGPGSGAARANGTTNVAGAGSANGGAGGDGNSTQATIKAGGGAGNPGGAAAQGGNSGASGTGGVLFIIATTFAGNGTVTAQGAAGGNATASSSAGTGGGGSGGGSITIMYGTDSSSITPNANGGAGGTGDGANGGAGGNGTARKLALA